MGIRSSARHQSLEGGRETAFSSSLLTPRKSIPNSSLSVAAQEPPQNADTWPPSDIATLGEATALSSRSPVSVKARLRSRRSQILIEGAKTENDGVQYLHHGLTLRSFARRFELADHVTIVAQSSKTVCSSTSRRKFPMR